ncbi:DEAD/DEAH box helicase [Bacillus alveayuensis]|uniref:DEAD/DEAH box helicase n=1 Tax=Aeribacillus alveayuensis TaxID=279215 RepID=UPI0005CCE697|nr:DEAD/DEAH box helicase [Bacillus alveayuensis]
MLNLLTLFVHPDRLENHFFSIVCTDADGIVIPVELWKKQLFVWHESSYFGTEFLTENDDDVGELILSPWQAVEFLAKKPYSSLLDVQFSDEAKAELDLATCIYDTVQKGSFMPDFTAFQQRKIAWRPIDFELDGEAKEWFSAAVSDLIERNPMLQEAWQEVLENHPVLASFGGHFLDEEDWLEKIGWTVRDLPFTIGLRLNEPEFDGDDWKLELFLRNKKNRDSLHFYEGEQSLPARWKKYMEFIEREQKRFHEILPWLSFQNGVTLVSEEEAWRFLTEGSETLVNMGIEILLPSWWKIVKEAKMQVKAKMSSTSTGASFVGMNQLIDFDWRFSTNGVELSEEEFHKLVEENRRLVQIRGQWIQLDPKFIEQMKQVLKRAEKEGLQVIDILEQELLEVKTSDIDQEDDLRAFANIQIELNAQMKALVKQMKEISAIPPVHVPDTFLGELRPYQEQGVNWLVFLRRFGFGACLADDMGLGKTVQMIAYFQYVKEHEHPEAPALIIAPTSVLGNWQKEFEKFAPHLNVKLYYGTNRKKGDEFSSFISDADIVITSYGLSHGDFDELSSVTWSAICLDEAQNIKNAHTKQSRSIRKLKGKHHIALTGTPMENRLTELWAIFDFINKGYLGTLNRFQRSFVLPIEKERNEKKIAELRKLIKPFLLRRTKRDEEVQLNLPDKQEQKEYIPLTVEQASLYEQLVKDTLDEIASVSGFERKALILKMLGKLKQLCNHPALYLQEESPKKIVDRSHKLEKLLELVAAIREQNESCLIFTQYIKMGEMMKNLLEKEFNTNVLFLNGSLSKAERDQMVEAFQNRRHHIFILSLKAGGTGLNLTAANHVIHFDRWWNPAVENQATDRAFRIGQKRFVHVHKLITTGTIEEKIDEMIEKKQSLNDQIIQSDNWITELSADELKELFTLSIG